MDLSVRDVARLLGVTEDVVVSWAKSGRLAGHRFDDHYHFNRVELQECARALGCSLPADLFAPEGEPVLSLADALARGGIHHVRGTTRDEVLRAVAGLPTIPKRVDSAFLAQLLVAREGLGSTGLGRGIAVPHPRDPLILGVREPTAYLCFLDQPVDFKAVDGKPVSTVFLLLAPTVKAHLAGLAALGRALHDAEMKRLVEDKADPETLLARLRAIEAPP